MSHAIAKHSSVPKVAVVLCTYNGARYLDEQLSSVLAQKPTVTIVASDDVSSDGTADKLTDLLRPEIDSLVIQLSNLGYVRNFETTLNRALESGASYFALSDQDDIWDEGRVACGMRKMAELEKEHGMNAPLLVHSDLRLIDADGLLLHNSFLAYRRYRISSCRNLALVLGENGVMGNTVLMNQAMAKLCLPFPDQLHVHDYWIALLAELFGHRAMLDIPMVDYRLHAQNASNTASSMRKGYRTILSNATWKKLWSRDFKLPFKEDTRLLTLNNLLDNTERFPDISVRDVKRIESFRDYLIFKQPRLRSFLYLLKSNMVRRGFFFRARLFVVIMLTGRYAQK
jgi:glycosyltransferase involved in cell wall biosynthesis